MILKSQGLTAFSIVCEMFSLSLKSSSERNTAWAVPGLQLVCRRLVLIAVTVAVCFCQLVEIQNATAQPPSATVVVPESECKVKYVYLYSFGLLTKWPESAFENKSAPFVIGVLGEKPFGRILDAIAKRKKIDGRRIIIRRFESMDEYKSCHILYVTESVGKEKATAVASTLKGAPVLIVGETPGFEFAGGVISFRIENENVKFSLNVDAVKRRDLVVSARLSKLASIVRDKDRRSSVSTAQKR